MTGFRTTLQEKIIGIDSHITLNTSKENHEKILEELSQYPPIDFVNDIIDFEGMIQISPENYGGIKIRGIQSYNCPKLEKWNIIFFSEFNCEDLSLRKTPGIILGEEKFYELGLTPGYPSLVKVINPVSDIGPSGEIEPKIIEYRVMGIFSSGYYDRDSQYALVDLNSAQELINYDPHYRQIQIFMRDLNKDLTEFSVLSDRYQNLEIFFWKDQNQRLFSALKLERIGMNILLGMVIFIASFNIICLISLLIQRKYNDAGILRAIGLNQSQLQHIFSMMGFYIGGLGTLIGLVLSGGVIFLLKTYDIPLPSAYYLEELPLEIEPGIILICIILSPFLSFGVGILSSLGLKNLDPQEIIRKGS